jgi:hypothetical protein
MAIGTFVEPIFSLNFEFSHFTRGGAGTKDKSQQFTGKFWTAIGLGFAALSF